MSGSLTTVGISSSYFTGVLLFHPEKLVKDDVITGLVSLFYPDPTKTSFLVFFLNHMTKSLFYGLL